MPPPLPLSLGRLLQQLRVRQPPPSSAVPGDAAVDQSFSCFSCRLLVEVFPIRLLDQVPEIEGDHDTLRRHGDRDEDHLLRIIDFDTVAVVLPIDRDREATFPGDGLVIHVDDETDVVELVAHGDRRLGTAVLIQSSTSDFLAAPVLIAVTMPLSMATS